LREARGRIFPSGCIAQIRSRQSVSSITSSEEFGTGAVILEGHRIFAFPGYADLATTVVYLAATDKLLFERGTEAGSIRKHKLFLSNVLDQLQRLNKMIILVGLASADRLPVVVRIPAGPLGSLKCDPPKGNGRRPQKR